MNVAGAPISWGVCEVPGWGYQLPAERFLTELRSLGLEATELGPDGYLSGNILRERGLRNVGAFVPVVLHDPDHDPLDGLSGDISEMLVLAAATGVDGYDRRPDLDEPGWRTLLRNLDRIAAAIPNSCLHPHVGTMVERREEVDRVLEGSAMPLCLDTGHLLIGGTDPAELARAVPDRIAHVHLKDVDATLAGRVTRGELTYTQAVAAGVYRPLGQGDVDVASIVRDLKDYRGWYVMEQDVILSGPEDQPLDDVRRSLAYLDEVARVG